MSLRNIQIPSNLIAELGVKQVIDITDALPKLKPIGWDGLNQPRNITALTDIVWHHSGMHLADGCSAESHANTHVRSGEGGNPYHLWLKDGQWYQCNDLLTFTYGAASNNTYTIHVCVEGCYSPKEVKGMMKEADVLSEENLKAMIAMELTLRQLLPSYKASNGHNYYRPTLCPGYSMTRFREEVAATEVRLNFKNSEKGLDERAFTIANQILFTYNTAKGLDPYGQPTISDGNRKWAQQQLLRLEEPMYEIGLMKRN